MKCDMCNEEVHEGSFGTVAGFICKKPECQEKAKVQRKAFFKRAWNPTEIKTAVDLNESMTLFADKYIKALKKGNRLAYEQIRKNNPIMLFPEQLQLDFTEKILAKLPRDYFTEERSRGHMRMFQGGTFELVKPIPAEVLTDAMVACGYINRKK